MSRRSRRRREAAGRESAGRASAGRASARRESGGQESGGRASGGRESAGRASGRPESAGRAWPRHGSDPLSRLSVQLVVLAAIFTLAVLVAELAGAANLGVSLGVGQVAFAIALVYLLLRR